MCAQEYVHFEGGFDLNHSYIPTEEVLDYDQ